MDGHWQIYALIFASAFLAVQGIRGLLADRAQRRQTSSRFTSINAVRRNQKEVELLKERSSRVAHGAAPFAIRKWLVQSGTNHTVPHLLLFTVVLTLLLYLPARRLGTVAGLPASAAAAVALLVLYLRQMRARRIGKFGEQLPDVVDIIVRSLKAGHPVPVSISLVGREMPSPAGPEFTLVFEEISYGRDFREALDNLSDRVGHPDLLFLITSIAIARQTGGNLAEILARLSKLIRDRFKVRRKVKALSAEGRFGGYILSVVPIFVFAIVSMLNPSYYREFWGTSGQDSMFLLAIALLIVGNITIYKMVNFKV